MKAEILSTGEEIRSGSQVDSNAAYVSEMLEETGIHVARHTCVGDDPEQIESVLQEIAGRTDIAVVTGGLGPTSDDVTSAAAARAAGVELIENPEAYDSLENFFKKRNYPMNRLNKKQALLPKGAVCLPNTDGTAPGFVLVVGRCTFFFLPGVPREMKIMLHNKVLPYIKDHFGNRFIRRRIISLSTFGAPESEVNDRIADLTAEFPRIQYGILVKFPEILIKLVSAGQNEQQSIIDLETLESRIIDRLGNLVFSREGESMETVVGNLLIKRRETIALAESCTGGLIANLLTDVPGISESFLFSGVTYSNEAKMNVLNVSEKTLRKYGAVHEETVKEMAMGARRVGQTTYGLSVSGIAGPGGGTPEKKVGTVCIGLAAENSVEGRRYCFPFEDRSMNKTVFAITALNRLRQKFLNSPGC